jgi:hypothetical protein
MENSKKETIEEASYNYAKDKINRTSHIIGFREGVKWQAEQDKKLYSEEEVLEIINSFEKLCYNYQSNKDWFPSKKNEWFEQIKIKK